MPDPGMHDRLEEVILDLRTHDDLVGLLAAPEAITEGWPNRTQQYPVVVRVAPVTETSTHRRSATQTTYRFQFSVVAEKQWRKRQKRPMYRIAQIMSTIGDRMAVAAPVEAMLPGGAGTGSWQDVEGDRLALVEDWRVAQLTSID